MATPVDNGVPRRLVPAVDRAVRILRLLADERHGLTLTQVATALGVGKSSVHDLLGTLTHHGLVQRDHLTRRYRLGVRLAELASLVRTEVDLASAVHAVLEDVATATGETVLLASWSGQRFVVVDRVVSSSDLRLTAPVGKGLNPLTGSFGKLLAAFDRLPEPLSWPGGRAWTTADRLREEAPKVRSQGFAVDDEEYLEGVWGVSAPVLGADGQLLGALTVVGLKGNPSRVPVETAVRSAQEAVRRIDKLLAAWRVASLDLLAAPNRQH
jgi:DNA-binding IclR family transcriptional regulator